MLTFEVSRPNAILRNHNADGRMVYTLVNDRLQIGMSQMKGSTLIPNNMVSMTFTNGLQILLLTCLPMSVATKIVHKWALSFILNSSVHLNIHKNSTPGNCRRH